MERSQGPEPKICYQCWHIIGKSRQTLLGGGETLEAAGEQHTGPRLRGPWGWR